LTRRRQASYLILDPLGHVTETTGHDAEFGGHDPETGGHDGPKYAAARPPVGVTR
jgi:hypothetical protein